MPLSYLGKLLTKIYVFCSSVTPHVTHNSNAIHDTNSIERNLFSQWNMHKGMGNQFLISWLLTRIILPPRKPVLRHTRNQGNPSQTKMATKVILAYKYSRTRLTQMVAKMGTRAQLHTSQNDVVKPKLYQRRIFETEKYVSKIHTMLLRTY